MFFEKTLGLVIVAPITPTNCFYFPLHVTLDERTKIQGQILSEQLKTMDTSARILQKVESLPSDLLDRVLKIIRLEF